MIYNKYKMSEKKDLRDYMDPIEFQLKSSNSKLLCGTTNDMLSLNSRDLYEDYAYYNTDNNKVYVIYFENDGSKMKYDIIKSIKRGEFVWRDKLYFKNVREHKLGNDYIKPTKDLIEYPDNDIKDPYDLYVNLYDNITYDNEEYRNICKRLFRGSYLKEEYDDVLNDMEKLTKKKLSEDIKKDLFKIDDLSITSVLDMVSEVLFMKWLN